MRLYAVNYVTDQPLSANNILKKKGHFYVQIPLVSVQLQHSRWTAAVSSCFSLVQQGRQRPSVVRINCAGQMVQLWGPGPLHSKQDSSQDTHL